jgi:transcriptional regulator with XRE-family HTH domain
LLAYCVIRDREDEMITVDASFMPSGERIMPGRMLEPADTPFAQWLAENVRARGLSLRALGERSDMTHARLSQYIGGDEAPRGAVERIARALVPDGLSEEEAEEAYRRLSLGGLRAAGYETPMDDDLRVFVEYFEGTPPEDREPLRDTLRLLRQLHRGGHVRPTGRDEK